MQYDILLAWHLKRKETNLRQLTVNLKQLAVIFFLGTRNHIRLEQAALELQERKKLKHQKVSDVSLYK